MQATTESLELTRSISSQINGQTFHHHYHILFDIANSYEELKSITYVEIGCYAGGSACLMLQRPNTTVVSIDLGIPIPHEVVMGNVRSLNNHGNKYYYLEGNSQSEEMVHKLMELVDSIDILFIDGDHSYQGVLRDFQLYSKLVKVGGFIVFDDYNDSEHSPEVKGAVDQIVVNYTKDYKAFGTIKNTLGARPSSLLEGNDYIIQKL